MVTCMYYRVLVSGTHINEDRIIGIWGSRWGVPRDVQSLGAKTFVLNPLTLQTSAHLFPKHV